MKKRIITILTTVVLLVLIGVLVVNAQDTESPEAEVAEAVTPSVSTLTLQQELPLFATVELNMNGQIYQVKVPVTLNINTEALLADAVLQVDEVNRVGNLHWQITEIRDYAESYALSRFQTVETSSADRKLTVIKSNLTNLSSQPIDSFSLRNILGVDESGRQYEFEDRSCEDINPGAVEECVLVFDVPQTVTIIGLDVTAPHNKVINFQPDTNDASSE